MNADERLKSLCEDIELVTGIKTVIYDEEQNTIYAHPNTMCDFCKEIRRSKELSEKCLQSDKHGFFECSLKRDIHIYHCHMGLIEAVAPITENDRIVGYFMLGQFLPEDGRDLVREKIESLHDSVNKKVLHAHLAAMSTTDDQHLRATARILSMSAAYVRLHEWMKQRKTTLSYKIESYVFEHLSEETLTSQSVSVAIGLSRTALYNTCKESFGMGLGEYIRSIRAATAVRLLRTTPLPLSHIAERVGIISTAQLTRLLKAQTGMTAKQIRALPDNDRTLTELT